MVKKIIVIFLLYLHLVQSDELKGDTNVTTNSLACIVCESIVSFVRDMKYINETESKIIDLAEFICSEFIEKDSLLCYGLKNQFREEFLSIIGAFLESPKEVCGIFINGCGTRPFSADWNIDLPPKPLNPIYPEYPIEKNKSIRVLQIADIHIDPEYSPGSPAECKQALCCQKSSKPKKVNKNSTAGYWGTLASCDIPYWTLENMLSHINETHEVDYVLLTGDYVSHKDWEYSIENHLAILHNLTDLIIKYFPNKPAFWTIGNHEGVPINNFAPQFAPEKFRPQWLYNELLNIQSKWIQEELISDIRIRGSFIVQIRKGLRLISLNSGYCETTNFWIYLNQTDPDGTLSWLVKELHRAEKDGQYVYILTHIPPGTEECLESWARNYYKIIVRFSNTIKAQFLGHVHVDTFTIFYENLDDVTSRPVSVMYMAPSVTTFKEMNPAYRIYEVQPGVHYEIINMETYFLNLSKNTSPDSAKWELLYKAKEEYSMKNLNAQSWDLLADEISNDNSMYSTFIKNHVRRDDYQCDGICRYTALCSLRMGHHNKTLCSYFRGFLEELRLETNQMFRKIKINHLLENENVQAILNLFNPERTKHLINKLEFNYFRKKLYNEILKIKAEILM